MNKNNIKTAYDDLLDLVKLADQILRNNARVAETFGKTAADPEAGLSEKVRRVLIAASQAAASNAPPPVEFQKEIEKSLRVELEHRKKEALRLSKELDEVVAPKIRALREYCENLHGAQSAIQQYMPKGNPPEESLDYIDAVLKATFHAMQLAQAEASDKEEAEEVAEIDRDVLRELGRLEGENTVLRELYDRMLARLLK